jgi:hypothetical protein
MDDEFKKNLRSAGTSMREGDANPNRAQLSDVGGWLQRAG